MEKEVVKGEEDSRRREDATNSFKTPQNLLPTLQTTSPPSIFPLLTFPSSKLPLIPSFSLKSLIICKWKSIVHARAKA
jgi:hypothetical protein